jgi:hypothetical protein
VCVWGCGCVGGCMCGCVWGGVRACVGLCAVICASCDSMFARLFFSYLVVGVATAGSKISGRVHVTWPMVCARGSLAC